MQCAHMDRDFLLLQKIASCVKHQVIKDLFQNPCLLIGVVSFINIIWLSKVAEWVSTSEMFKLHYVCETYNSKTKLSKTKLNKQK